MITENPRHQRELLFTADRTHHRTLLAVKLCRAQQIRIGITDLRDAGAPRIDLSQQGPPPKRVIHHLSLQSHDDQSTSTPWTPRRDRVTPPTIIFRGNSADLDHPGQGQRSRRHLQGARQRARRRPVVHGRTPSAGVSGHQCHNPGRPGPPGRRSTELQCAGDDADADRAPAAPHSQTRRFRVGVTGGLGRRTGRARHRHRLGSVRKHPRHR